MRIYPNPDGSFDVVNLHKVLFHVEEGKCPKVIGRITEKWQHARKAINFIPLCVMKFEDQLITTKIEPR